MQSLRRAINLLEVLPSEMQIGKAVETMREMLVFTDSYWKNAAQKEAVLKFLAKAWLDINGRENDPYFRCPDTVSSFGMIRELSLSRPMVSLLLSRLKRDGLVSFTRRRMDRHRVPIKAWMLTERGWAVYRRLKEQS